MYFFLPKLASAQTLTLPTLVIIDGKVLNYLTWRSEIIAKQNSGKLQIGSYNDERKNYFRMINLEYKIKPLKGRTIREINQEILTRKL